MTSQPRGILRNAPPPGSYYDSNVGPLNRNEVLENTKANAKLSSLGSQIAHQLPSHGQGEPNGNVGIEHARDLSGSEERLQWDEANIDKTEAEKSATMKIDEPKTPFQGAVGDSEYYLPDEDEDFSLGEPQHAIPLHMENDRIVRDPDQQDEDEDEDEDEDVDVDEEEIQETPEEHHRRFDEMRKAHYHMKGEVLKHPIPIDPEDEEDEDEDEDDDDDEPRT